jgi:hypothetical protein
VLHQDKHRSQFASRFFFLSGTNPIFDGTERNINPMMAPKMPTCFPERQAIVNDEAKGKFDHGIGVIGFRRSNVGCVDGEVLFALAAVMGGIV